MKDEIVSTNLDKARCKYCGWLVSDEGVTIPWHLDEAPEDGEHRCDDSACVSERVVTVDGDELRYARMTSGPTQPEDEVK